MATGSITVGQIVAFVNYLLRTLIALMLVGMLLIRVSRAQASGKRLSEVLEIEPEVRETPGSLQSFAPRGHVAFEDVAFSYNGKVRDQVLKEVSLEAEPGQTIAILGATGSEARDQRRPSAVDPVYWDHRREYPLRAPRSQ